MSAQPDGGGPQAALQREISSCRRKLALQALGRRLLILLALAAVPPLLFVVADHSEPAGVQRATALTIAYYWRWLVGLSCLGLLVATFRRRLNPLFAARELERASGIDHNSVVNAVLLQREPGAAYASAAAAEQATADMSEHWPPRVAESGALRLPLALAAVVVLAWLGYGLLAPKPVWPSVARFFGARLPPPTATTLEQVRPRPGGAVHAGQSLELEFAARGGTVRHVTFEMLAAAGSPVEQAVRYELKLGSQPNANWELTLAPHEVSHDIHYRCTANDAVLTGTIPVLPIPRLAGLEIELEPPAYSGLPVQVVSNPDLEVLAGTRATFRAFANTPVENPTFVLSNSRETRMRMDVDERNPRRFGVSLLLVEGGQYHLEFCDPLGAPVTDPPVHQITLRPDSAPTLRIVAPPETEIPDGVVDITRQPMLAVEATDDVHLAELDLVRADAGVLARTRLKLDLEADGRHGRVQLATADLPLKPGQQMRAWFEVSDSRQLLDGTPAPQTTRSRELLLTRPAQVALNRPNTSSQTTAEKPAQGSQQQHAAGQQAESRPVGNNAPASAPGQQTGNQGNSQAGSSGEGGFEHELKRFVEENGEMARDLGRSIPKPGAEQEPGGSESQEPPQSQPATSGSPQGDQKPSEDSAAGGQQEPPATQPEGNSTPQSQPSSGSANSSSSRPTSPAGDENQTEQNKQDSQPDQSSESAQRQGKPGESDHNQGGGPAQPQQRGNKADQTSKENADGSRPPSDSENSGVGTGNRHADSPTEGKHPSLPQAPPQPNWREQTKPLQTEGLTETLDLLEWMDRGGTVDEKMLIDLGWPADRAAGFVKSLERLHEQARQFGGLDDLRILRMRLTMGDPNVQRGGALSSAARTAIDQARPREDDLRRIAPPPEQEVPPELRALLDAYYRALAERQDNASR